MTTASMTAGSRTAASRDSRDYWITSPSLDGQVTTTALRTRSLRETEAIARECLDRCGITRIADVTDLDTVGIPVYHSMRPAAAPGLNTVTSGKGSTREVARVSAIMEAIERTWCELYEDAVVNASYRELLESGTPVLDPRRLILRRDHTWAEDAPMGWWPAHELASDTKTLVPALSVFTPYPREHGMFSSNTIGLAVGNTAQEAFLHGLLEVIEHDCTAFGESLRQGYRIRPESLPDEPARLFAMLERAGIEVQMYLYLTEIGVPTIQVTTEDVHDQDGMLFNGGVGCHLDPEIASVRALTEAAQSRVNIIAGAREDFDRQAYRRHTSYDGLKEMYHAWAVGREEINFADIPSRTTGTVSGDLDLALAGLLNVGIGTILVTELAPGGFPFSVTKVIVPGLEVYHEDQKRLGPRLSARIRELAAAGSLGDNR
ncbi:ribosomal protein S12 methylthiotransferase accessory factor [Nonomuraea polychroma]|uniref:Ribosomal protein S12 methylthiotransferase accessory factor n=1 Tax=Nonomuraea polychroma TaxID=46176 RepID=A0A438LY36_9ACTN|nr:YcaO-like family protein [Nonomuraea polychroma]RVX38371.1 ribosomal protein S12 methylthiotransferase accessory factor [Nonomuraea polychroma]